MKTAVFVDTSWLVALLDPRDMLHETALRLARVLENERRPLLSTDAVFIEFANYFSRSPLRAEAASWIATLRAAEGWEILPLERALVLRSEARYRRHRDKSWSLTDCIGMEVMLQRGVREAATTDAGFEQAGMRALLRGS